jgi:D-alanyl-D-alanine carboxypeptidase
MSIAINLMRWNKLDSSGKPQHHPIDDALPALYQLAMCGSGNGPVNSARSEKLGAWRRESG